MAVSGCRSGRGRLHARRLRRLCSSKTSGAIGKSGSRNTGLEPMFPVWGLPTARLAEDMIEKGLQARLLVHRHPRARPPLRRTSLRSIPSERPARQRRSVRRERRVPHLRHRRADVRERTRPRDGRDRDARTVRLDRSRAATRMSRYPSRIVCLTEETTETLYLLGEGHRVVGVSGYTVRPPEARRKPRVSAFISAKYDRIEELQPDLILAFSDLQATITCELVKRGYPVVAFNQRSIAEILQMIRMVGALVGCADRADALAAEPRARDRFDSSRSDATSSAAARLLRGMGRSADFGHPVGRRTHRGRRRRTDLSRASRCAARPRPNRFLRGRDRTPAGRDHRVVVREGRAS